MRCGKVSLGICLHNRVVHRHVQEGLAPGEFSDFFRLAHDQRVGGVEGGTSRFVLPGCREHLVTEEVVAVGELGALSVMFIQKSYSLPSVVQGGCVVLSNQVCHSQRRQVSSSPRYQTSPLAQGQGLLGT